LIEEHDARHPNRTEDDREVLIELALPSMGPKASCRVKYAGFGIDWDRDFLITAEKPLVPKTDLQKLWEDARDLIMYLATKPVKRPSYEIREARRMLDHYNIEYKAYAHLFHKEVRDAQAQQVQG